MFLNNWRNCSLKKELKKGSSFHPIASPSSSEGHQAVGEGGSSSGNSPGHTIPCLLSDMSLLSFHGQELTAIPVVCWNHLVSASESSSVRVFPIPHSMVSCWWLEIGLCGNMDTLEIGKYYWWSLFPSEGPSVKHGPAHRRVTGFDQIVAKRLGKGLAVCPRGMNRFGEYLATFCHMKQIEKR